MLYKLVGGFGMRIEIAPSFSCDDWDRMKATLAQDGDWAASPAQWKRAIEVVQNRIKTRFLDTAARLQNVPYAGFAIMALDCLLIETIQAFKSGKHAKNPQESRQAYEAFLTSSSRFGKFFPPTVVQNFYTYIRNGLLHDGETRGGWLVKTDPKYDLLTPQPGGFFVVNRQKFHKALDEEFRKYIKDLSDPAQKTLRKNLVNAVEDLCKRSRP
jgi:hypothetical protein